MSYEQVFNAAAGYGRHFRVDKTLRHHTTIPPGQVILMLKEDASRQVAREIMQLEDVFRVQEAMPGLHVVSADFFVMTTEQMREFAIHQFREGMKHASGFMPTYGEPFRMEVS